MILNSRISRIIHLGRASPESYYNKARKRSQMTCIQKKRNKYILNSIIVKMQRLQPKRTSPLKLTTMKTTILKRTMRNKTSTTNCKRWRKLPKIIILMKTMLRNLLRLIFFKSLQTSTTLIPLFNKCLVEYQRDIVWRRN